MINSTVDYSLIGNRIKNRRNEIGITQEQLANNLGMTTYYISKIENRHAHPTLDTLAMIAFELNIDLSVLITGTSTLEKVNYSIQLNDIYSKANYKQLDLIIKIAKK